MTKILAVTAAFLALFAVGCTDNQGAAQTVKSAYVSLEKNQTQDFVSLLSGEALATYGTPDGIVALQKTISGLSLKIGDTERLSNDGVRETWSVVVNTKENTSTPILTAHLLCYVGYVEGGESRSCSITSIQIN